MSYDELELDTLGDRKTALGDLKKVVSLMRYASNNLNQYAKKANETGSIYLEDIQDLQKRFDQIWEELKGIHTRLASIE